ncbi:Uncharacterized conserved protein YjbJ, UPF0337 family [Rhizobiales bacterium GAS113]|nr:Uncharacterized conserved protein YjbJ, UPF0337 family [Rhizobiales bacterium GAS113]
MNKDTIQGGMRKVGGEVEEIAGRTLRDKQTTGKGIYEQAAGEAQSSYGKAKDAVSVGASDLVKDTALTFGKAKDAVGQTAQDAIDAVKNTDFEALRSDLAKLTQTVSQLVQNQASSTRDFVSDAVGTASDNIAQTASAAQDQLLSFQGDLEERVKANPIAAIAISFGVGVLFAKLT